MITELFFDIVFLVIKSFVLLLPTGVFVLPDWTVEALSLIHTGLCIFPFAVFQVAFGNFMFWQIIHFTWAIIEWVYKKIPGID